MNIKFKQVFQENRGFVLFLLLMFAFRSAVADWNHVPSGSMQPTIEIGDRIFVNKLAYDVRIPFTDVSLHRLADPLRGDIVIFDSAVSKKRLVKRVVGVPGDVIEMRDNRLRINGQALSYTKTKNGDLSEDLLGIDHIVRTKPFGSRLSNFAAVRIPQGQYLMLGDNRDVSVDSRVIGLVPRAEIKGRAGHVVVSFNYDNYYLPRGDRYLQAL